MPLWVAATAAKANGPVDVAGRVISIAKKAAPAGVGQVPEGYRETRLRLEQAVPPAP